MATAGAAAARQSEEEDKLTAGAGALRTRLLLALEIAVDIGRKGSDLAEAGAEGSTANGAKSIAGPGGVDRALMRSRTAKVRTSAIDGDITAAAGETAVDDDAVDLTGGSGFLLRRLVGGKLAGLLRLRLLR